MCDIRNRLHLRIVSPLSPLYRAGRRAEGVSFGDLPLGGEAVQALVVVLASCICHALVDYRLPS